ncbi:MAG TPA: type II toxin-antitoxin system PemK/MazF family toxin [Nocardioidaceae bacterium]|nr:type II toxin-antitoxin system PemK/MazF family toxin [Nocardioidaceae bacterium]
MARSRLGNLVRTFLRQATTPQHGSGPVVDYSPNLDGRPDPGEVVWAWVPYDDDPTQGKDRPVLLIGRDGPTLLGLQLSSQDHDLDADDEARHGRYWMDIGSGRWDSAGRPSEVRLDRLLRLDQDGVRREGAVLDRDIFDAVIAAARTHHAL